MKKEIYELIKEEIDDQYLWLMDTKHTLYDIDIAFSAIKHIINKYIGFPADTCDDCISRKSAKEIIDYYIQFYDGQFRINESIDNLPSVQPLCKSVIEDIKAEIESGRVKVENDYDHGRNYGLYMATQIIDKHIADMR